MNRYIEFDDDVFNIKEFAKEVLHKEFSPYDGYGAYVDDEGKICDYFGIDNDEKITYKALMKSNYKYIVWYNR